MRWRRAWQSIVLRLTGRRREVAVLRRSRPRVEALEDRLVPANWFVSALGSDANPGWPTAPFASIQHAVNVASSGDRIHVAQGLYSYNSAADRISDDARFGGAGGTLSGSVLHVSPTVVLVYDKALQIYGGFDNAFTAWSPSQFRTYISGGSAVRGVYVLDDNGAAGPAFATPAGLDLEGFTVESCRATGEAGLPGPDNVNAYGAGLWVNAAARAAATQGGFQLKNMVFRGNVARGSNTSDIGGTAAGAAMALRGVGGMTLDDVTFDTNVSFGGQGATRGGQAQGAVSVDHSAVSTDVGSTLTFYNNQAQGGFGSGGGRDAGGNTADALGGGLAVTDGTATLRNVIALFNSVLAGSAPGGTSGSAYGGAFFAARGTLNLFTADIRGSVVQGGIGQNIDGPGGLACGGGVAVLNANLTLSQVQVIANTLSSGSSSASSPVAGGVPAGGGAWVTRSLSSAALSAVISNSVIADNAVRFDQLSGANGGGGGGGIWLQGVNAVILHTTVAENANPLGQLGGLHFAGQAVLLTSGSNADGSPRAATATIGYSILANNLNSSGAAALDVAGSPNAVTLNHVLYANNTKDDNSDGLPNAAGGFSGLNTVIRAANAGFTSAGGPNFDYSIGANSPAVNQATDSTAGVDIQNNPRTGTPDLGAYEAPAPPRARSSVALFDPETAIWQIRQSNAGGFFPDGPVFHFGSSGGLSKPVAGDWDGDGVKTVGVVEVLTRNDTGQPFLTDANGNPVPVTVFELRDSNSNNPNNPDIVVPYGSSAATPVVGNWDNNPQHIDHIGVVEVQNGVAVWKLKNSFTRGAPDIQFAYGGPADVPLVGDWNGDGTASPGVVENVSGRLTWNLRNTFTAGPPDAGSFDYGFAYNGGAESVVPVTGDWNNDRIFTPGIYDGISNLWQLRNENSIGPPDAGVFTFGPTTGSNYYAESWIPLAGDFDGQ